MYIYIYIYIYVNSRELTQVPIIQVYVDMNLSIAETRRRQISIPRRSSWVNSQNIHNSVTCVKYVYVVHFC